MDHCVFCRIIEGTLPSYRIHEDEWTVSFLDIKPVGLGHTLLVPRRHFGSLLDMAPDEACRLMESLRAVARAVTGALGADGFNVFLNDGVSAGQIVPHLHFHVLPRRTGDGILFRAVHQSVSEAQMRGLQEAVRKYLGSGKG